MDDNLYGDGAYLGEKASSPGASTVSGATVVFVWGAVLILLVWIGLYLIRRFNLKKQHLHHRLFKVRLPKEKEKEDERMTQKDIMRAEIARAEAVIESIGGLRAQKGFASWLKGRDDVFSLELVSQNGRIDFYLAAPEYSADYLEKQVHAQFPEAEVEVVADYNIFGRRAYVAAGFLTTRRQSVLPIKTYMQEEVDSLSSVLNAMSKLDREDNVAVQLTVRSARRAWHRRSVKLVRRAYKLNSLDYALKSNRLFNVINFFFNHHTREEQNRANQASRQLTDMEKQMLKAIEDKSSKAGLDANLRIIVSSPSIERAEHHLYEVASSFSQYNYFDFGNGFVSAPVRLKHDRVVHDFIHRRFNDKQALLLNTEEAASLFHFPLPITETPNINWLNAKSAAAPLELPDEGLVLGFNEYRGQRREVRIKYRDRLRHVYMIGKSGVGKSVLLANMAIQDVLNGDGLCVLDPHGDLVEDILARVPAHRAEDVILFSPADTKRPVGLNLLEYDARYPEQKSFVINEMIGIFDKLYDLKATGGPIFEQYMRNAMLLIMNDAESGATLMDIPRVLSDTDYRQQKLAACSDQTVVNFWINEAERAGGDAALANIVPYVTSKLTSFISNDMMRPIIGQRKSSFNLRDVMDEKKILLISLPKGLVGEMNAYLLGMILVGKVLMAALSRADSPQAERSPFYLYIDEFQNFTTASITQVLSEARKYGLGLTLAHQYIGQLVKHNDTSIKDAVYGNVGTMISFKVGPEDADFLEKAYKPQFSAQDLVNVDKYTAFVRLLIDNANPRPFTMKTPWPLVGRVDQTMAEKIRSLSRLRYGSDRELVEAEIRLNLSD